MTLKQYLRHVAAWLALLRDFPLPWKDIHTTSGPAGGDWRKCLICELVIREADE